MVYGGKPSTGCHLCRKRKIKCDEARPGCRNCTIYGRPCPGYRPTSDSVFRNETTKVERQVKKSIVPDPTSASLTVSQKSESPGTLDHYNGNSSMSNNSLSLINIADASWEERAICYFFDQFISPPDKESGMGHLDYLPGLYSRIRQHKSASSSLPWALEATALMTLANVSQAPQLIIQARRGYGRALSTLRRALASPTEALKDETFASVVLLSLFEDVTGERNGLFSSHTAGFEFLMKLRGESQLNNSQGRNMFSFAYAHTYVEILALGDKPRVDMDFIIDQFNGTVDPVERLMLATSKIRKVFLAMQTSSSPPDITTVQEWIAAGEECEREVSQWSLHLPDHWLPLIVYSNQGEPLITYNSIAYCVVWNYHRAARVMIQQLLLNLNHTLSAILSKTKEPNGPLIEKAALDETKLRAVIQEMTADVSRSLQFAMADVDTLGRPTVSSEARNPSRAGHVYGLLWPLWYIVSCGMPTPDQVKLICTVLHRIGHTHGIVLASILAREAEKLPVNVTSNSIQAPPPYFGEVELAALLRSHT
ncbi:uncharacterized protein N7483_003874 [Penicillium malachiteum]|uniref:uncharacterized protein n=1 Tax=Penicillium malachiteum TaxID=1324776 RepID=UPI0025468EF5|nr:uncharacterized protein N7483_003874 [Penicillium malachiteum]KAJ5729366.1 hypothetical protein N7483_003874 [Penicillium malachiteum]